MSGGEVEAPTLRSVGQALAAVMSDLPAIGKNDVGAEGYVYRGIEAITKHLQPLLAKHGVIIVPSGTLTDQRPSPAMKEGWTDTHLAVDWQIVGPDGSFLMARTNGIGRDRSDKGGNKAATQAFKVLLLQLFCVADTKDDSDGLTYEQDRQEAPKFTKTVAKKVAVREFRMRDMDEAAAKAEAAAMWVGFGMDRLELTEEVVVGKVEAWASGAEPFGDDEKAQIAAEADVGSPSGDESDPEPLEDIAAEAMVEQ